MGKRFKNVSLQTQSGWFNRHRESLEDGGVYEPFWRVEDVRSWGIKTKIPHVRANGRLVHVLSQNELWMYLHLCRHPFMMDVYEQYAIPLADSMAIATELNVRHPVYAGTKTPIVQTIDFVVDMLDPATGEIQKMGIAVKQSGDELRERTGEKLLVQEAYCAHVGMDYHLVTGDFLRTTESETLETLFRYRQLPTYMASLCDQWRSNFLGALSDDRHEKLARLIERASARSGCNYLTGVSIFYNALWHKTLTFSWTQLLKLELAASDLGVCANG